MSITYKEYVWLVERDKLKQKYKGGVMACPKCYGISDDDICTCGNWGEGCNDCWNQEIQYSVIAEVIRDTCLNSFEKITVGAKYEVTDVDMGSPEVGVRIYVAGCKWWANNNNFIYYIDKEEKKVQKKFTKADLKDGMMCETAEGKKMLWINGAMRGTDTWCSATWNYLTASVLSRLDIVRVGYPDFDRYCTISQALDGDFKEVLWERKQEKEISSEEAFSVLKEHYGCDVKIKE